MFLESSSNQHKRTKNKKTMAAISVAKKVPVSVFYEMGKVAGGRFFVLLFPADTNVSTQVLARKIHRELGVRVGFVESPHKKLCQFVWGPVSTVPFTAKFLADLQTDHPYMVPGFRWYSSISAWV